MLSTSELKKQAKSNLQGKWSKAIIIGLIYIGITLAISLLSSAIPFLSIAFLVITIPLEFGVIFSYIKLYRGEEMSYGDLFTSAFKNFSQIWKIVGNQFLKLILPIILVVVSAIVMFIGIFLFAGSAISEASNTFLMYFSLILLIIGYVAYIASCVFLFVKSLLYSLSYYIFTDNPNMTAKEIVEESAKIMNGQRGKYFVLELSFIGWVLLATLTFGIGMIFLQPYIQFATIAFYEDRKINN